MAITAPSSSSSILDSMRETMNASKVAAASAESTTEAQDRFMKLLVTQMRNQDPLNPLDNAQVTSQLAQLSTVSGISKLNTTLESLVSGFNANQSLQAAGMIGRGVLTDGSTLALSQGQALMGLNLSEAADAVSLTIRDAAGNAVRTLALGPRSAGVQGTAWDGKTDSGAAAADGTYQIEAKATRNGAPVTASTLSYASVNSVSTGAEGVKLSLSGGKTATLSDLRQIF